MRAIPSKFLACMPRESWFQPWKPWKHPFLAEFLSRDHPYTVRQTRNQSSGRRMSPYYTGRHVLKCRRFMHTKRPCNAHWRSSSLVKNLERQWRNGWCLTQRLAMSVTSQVPIFSVSALDVHFWRGIEVSHGDLIYKDLFWASNMRRKREQFFLHIWRRGTSAGRISSRHRFAQPRNQSKSFRKNQTFIPPSLWCTTDDMTNRQTNRKT